jgi:hypothetical protein
MLNRKKQDMPGQKCQLTVNGVTSSSAVAAEAARVGRVFPSPVTLATRDFLAEGVTSAEPEGAREGPVPNVGSPAIAVKPASERLALPDGRAVRSSSWEPLDPNTRALSEIKKHVARTLHETVMQTLVGTIYLAESPDTSRRDLVEHLRRATQELRSFIDSLATMEAGS